VQERAGYEVDEQMDRWQIGMCALALIFLTLVPCSDAHAESDWALTLYSGKMTDAALAKTATFNFEFENAYLVDLGLSRRLYTFQNYFDIEIEGQIARYFGDQDNWEFDLVAYFRWLLFPWNEYLNTSFAAGAGLSYATSVPAIEAKLYEETAQFLGALMFEFAFSLPQVPQWSLVTGIHHRSGAGGVFSGVQGASNAWVIGIRYKF
jgi:hypothetical protein